MMVLVMESRASGTREFRESDLVNHLTFVTCLPFRVTGALTRLLYFVYSFSTSEFLILMSCMSFPF